jgi:hypothetical protein
MLRVYLVGMQVNQSTSIGGDEAFLRQFVFPEEERPLWTTAKWDGSYRWFQSPNVICLERYRSQTELARICAVLLGR